MRQKQEGKPMEMQQTHLDRTEKFAEWLEEQRKLAGVDRKDLYAAGVISESTYSKFVTIGNIRKKHGDQIALQFIPKTKSDVFLAVLKFIAKATKNEEIVAEGLTIWGMHEEEVERIIGASESNERIGGIVACLGKLPPEDLKTVHEIVSKFAMLV